MSSPVYKRVSENPFVVADRQNSADTQKEKNATTKTTVLQAGNLQSNKWRSAAKLALLGFGIASSVSSCYFVQSCLEYKNDGNTGPLIGFGALTAVTGLITLYGLKQLFNRPAQNLLAKKKLHDRQEGERDSPRTAKPSMPTTSPSNVVELPDLTIVENFEPLKTETEYTTESLTQPVTLGQTNETDNSFPTTLPDFREINFETVSNADLTSVLPRPFQVVPITDEDDFSTDESDPTIPTDDGDYTIPTHLPPVWDESLLVPVDNILPPDYLPPVLGNHDAYVLSRTCQEFYETEVAFFGKLEVMSKLQIFFSKEKIQELCNDVSSYLPELGVSLDAALKELLQTNNIEILKEFSQNVQNDLINYDRQLKNSEAHNEQDNATVEYAQAITSQSNKFTKAVINATFRHMQAFWDISSIFKKIAEVIKENVKLNPSVKVPQHPWNKCMEQFKRKNKSLRIPDLSFEGLFIDVMQRFPRIELFSKEIKKYTGEFQKKQMQELQNHDLVKSVSEFNQFNENLILTLNNRMKERDLLQEGQDILQAIKKSETSGYKLAFNKNEKTQRIIAKKTSFKKMVIGSDDNLDEIHTLAQNHIKKCIEILNRRLGNQELASYCSESDQEFNERKKQLLTSDTHLLKSFKNCLKSIIKQPEKSGNSSIRQELKKPLIEFKKEERSIGSVGEVESSKKSMLSSLTNISTPRIFSGNKK